MDVRGKFGLSVFGIAGLVFLIWSAINGNYSLPPEQIETIMLGGGDSFVSFVFGIWMRDYLLTVASFSAIVFSIAIWFYDGYEMNIAYKIISGMFAAVILIGPFVYFYFNPVISNIFFWIPFLSSFALPFVLICLWGVIDEMSIVVSIFAVVGVIGVFLTALMVWLYYVNMMIFTIILILVIVGIIALCLANEKVRTIIIIWWR